MNGVTEKSFAKTVSKKRGLAQHQADSATPREYPTIDTPTSPQSMQEMLSDRARNILDQQVR